MEKETLKSLREKAKVLRSKVSSAPLSKATPDQLRSEISMLERAVKADEKVQARKALKEATVVPAQKKKITLGVVPRTTLTVAPPKMSDREKDLIKREALLAKREKVYKRPMDDSDSESEDY